MKKIFVWLCIILLTVGLFQILPVYAASASISGPATVHPGETFTVTVSAAGGSFEGFQGTLQYDSSLLTLVSTAKSVASPWKLETSGNKILLYDDELSAPISGGKLFTANFQVSSSATVGASVSVSVTGTELTDAELEPVKITVPSYSATVAAAASSNNNLASLSVNGLTLSPQFSAATVKYDAGTVANSVTSVTVQATAADAKARVAVTNTTLAVGTNNVIVTVTAENGSTKQYVITVTRASAGSTSSKPTSSATSSRPTSSATSSRPTSSATSSKVTSSKVTSSKVTSSKVTSSKVTSSKTTSGKVTSTVSSRAVSSAVASKPTESVSEIKSTLSELRIEGFELSPAFDPSVLEYRVTVPNITESVLIYAAPEQASAKGITIAGDNSLKVGENTVTVTCTAADDTVTEYTVIVTREAEETTSAAESEKPTESTAQDTKDLLSDALRSQFNGWMLVAVFGIVLVLLLLGCMIGFALRGALERKRR